MMLEIRKTAVALGGKELLELGRIVVDSDEKAAFRFVEKTIYERIVHAQQGRLKSHLDAANPVEGSIQHSK